MHPFLSNHCFTVFLQLSLFLSARPQLPPEFLRMLSLSSTSLHRCLFPHISFHAGSSQVQTRNPRFVPLSKQVHGALVLGFRDQLGSSLGVSPFGSGCMSLVSGRKERRSPLPLLLPPLASDCAPALRLPNHKPANTQRPLQQTHSLPFSLFFFSRSAQEVTLLSPFKNPRWRCSVLVAKRTCDIAGHRGSGNERLWSENLTVALRKINHCYYLL